MNDSEIAKFVEESRSEAIFWSRAYWTVFAVTACTFAFEMIRLLFEWLRNGTADKVILSNWFSIPQFEWVGVQRIITFICNLPIWLLAVFIMTLSVFAAEYNEERAKAIGKHK